MALPLSRAQRGSVSSWWPVGAGLTPQTGLGVAWGCSGYKAGPPASVPSPLPPPPLARGEAQTAFCLLSSCVSRSPGLLCILTTHSGVLEAAQPSSNLAQPWKGLFVYPDPAELFMHPAAALILSSALIRLFGTTQPLPNTLQFAAAPLRSEPHSLSSCAPDVSPLIPEWTCHTPA